MIPAGRVHVWFAFPDAVVRPELLERCRGLLSPDERRRQQRLVRPRARRRFLVAHAFVRDVLSSYAGVAPEEWTFATNEHGKPEIVSPAERPPLRFNLSHTEGMVVCAVTLEHDLGVDVEMTRRPVDASKLAARFFSPQETAALQSLPEPEQTAAFFDYWTLKEAYLKAVGRGLSLPLRSCSFRLEPEHPPRVSFPGEWDDDPGRWSFFLVNPGPRHRGAVAVRHTGEVEIGIELRGVRPG